MAQGSFNLRAIISLVDRISGPLQRISGNLTTLGVGFAAVGAAGGLIGKELVEKVINTSAEFEKFGTILETIEGSSEKAAASMDWVTDFATRTPYELGEVTGAFVKLKSYGIEPQAGALEAAGNAAAGMGKDVMSAVEALADAMTGENERLKEFGIRAEKAGGNITYRWLENGKRMKATVDGNNAEMIEKVVSGIWNRRYAGAMEKLSKTWGGMWSNMLDHITGFWKLIGDTGFFDFAKSQLRDLLDLFARMKADGSLQDLANTISIEMVKAGQALRGWIDGIDWRGVIDGAWETWDSVRSVVDAVGGFGRIIAGFALLAAAPFLASLGAIAAALWSLGAVLLTTPIGAVIAAIAAGAYVIYDNWAKVGPWFADVWGGISRAFGSAVAGVKALISGDWAAARQSFDRVWSRLDATISRALDAALPVLRDFAGRAWQVLGDVAGRAMAAVRAINWPELGVSIGGAIGDGIIAAGQWLGSLFSGEGDVGKKIFWGLVDLGYAIITFIGGIFLGLGDTLVSWARGVDWGAVGDALLAGAGALIDAVGRLGERIGAALMQTVRLNVPSWALDMVGLGGANDNAPAAAAGGSSSSGGGSPSGIAAAAARPSIVAAQAQAGQAKVDGEVRVRFDNAPPGMTVAAAGAGGLDLPVDVGRRSVAR